MLSEAGYRVLEARDGQEALTILEVHADVRALFTDVTMPNIDGLSLAKIVSERWPQIGILLTSGLVAPSELPNGARFIGKPYEPETVHGETQAVSAEAANVLKGGGSRRSDQYSESSRWPDERSQCSGSAACGA